MGEIGLELGRGNGSRAVLGAEEPGTCTGERSTLLGVVKDRSSCVKDMLEIVSIFFAE